jgi:hypothetical protein
MPIVIDANSLINETRRLPTEAFFVDTNIIIDFTDPFGISTTKPTVEDRVRKITKIVGRLKSTYKSFSTFSVAMEYYKHIQFNTYTLYNETKKLDIENFKKLKSNDIEFMQICDSQVRGFRKTFIF